MQQLGNLLAIAPLVAPDDAQRQRDILEGRQVIEQAEILEHDADPAPQSGKRVLVERDDVAIEQGDQPAGRLERQEQQPQQRGLSGAGGAGQKLKRMRLDAKRQVAQYLRPEAVPQSDVFKTDHPKSPMDY